MPEVDAGVDLIGTVLGAFSVRSVGVMVAGSVLLFWVVGAYNRLVSLRNELAQAWVKVQQPLQQRAAAIEPLVAALREPMAAEAGALDALLATHAQALKAAAQMSTRPVSREHAQAWVLAETALTGTSSRVRALLEQRTDLMQLDPVRQLLAGWVEAEARLPFVRQLFNETAGAYNLAVGEIPTRVVASGFGFRPAGRI